MLKRRLSFNTNPVGGFVGINLYVLSQMTLMEILGLINYFSYHLITRHKLVLDNPHYFFMLGNILWKAICNKIFDYCTHRINLTFVYFCSLVFLKFYFLFFRPTYSCSRILLLLYQDQSSLELSVSLSS